MIGHNHTVYCEPRVELKYGDIKIVQNHAMPDDSFALLMEDAISHAGRELARKVDSMILEALS